MKTVLQATGGVAILILAIVVYNVVSPVASMSRLWEGYWAGYYDTQTFGRVWCLARFYRTEDQKITMVLLSPKRTIDVMDVERDSSGETFLLLKMSERSGDMKLQAKQLYVGQRYILGRLMAGRFKDFWERNSDDAIRGHWISRPGQPEFAIERIPEDRVITFCKDFVLREHNFGSVAELERFLSAVKVSPANEAGAE